MTPEEESEEALSEGFSNELKRVLSIVAIGLALLALVYLGPWRDSVDDIGKLRELFRDDGIVAELGFVAFTTVLVCLGAPRLTFYIGAGTLFGFIKGLLLAQLGAMLGAYVTFAVVRHGGRHQVSRWLGKYPRIVSKLQTRSGIAQVFLARQLPLHSLIITSALALTNITSGNFLAGTFIGFLPQGIIAAMIGAGIGDKRYLPFIAGAGILASIAALAFAAWRKWHRRQHP